MKYVREFLKISNMGSELSEVAARLVISSNPR
jgi:hypothetical protein